RQTETPVWIIFIFDQLDRHRMGIGPEEYAGDPPVSPVVHDQGPTLAPLSDRVESALSVIRQVETLSGAIPDRIQEEHIVLEDRPEEVGLDFAGWPAPSPEGERVPLPAQLLEGPRVADHAVPVQDSVGVGEGLVPSLGVDQVVLPARAADQA